MSSGKTKKPRMKVEYNPFAKSWRRGSKGVALIYPNRYVGGISNLGLQYIYSKINSLPEFICERFYTDVFNGLRSLESGNPLKNFNFAFFSLQYEEDIFNVYEILKKSDFRGLKVAGGPCVMENPFPYADLFDVMYVGEVEGSQYVERLLELKNKRDIEELGFSESPFFIPKVLAGKINGEVNGEIKVKRARGKVRDHLRNEIISDGAYGRALLLEIGRGCRRNCRFCIVRQIYSPVRWRDKETLLEVAENHRKIVDKVALIAPSPSDHPDFKEIVFSLQEMGYAVSPSSLRADKLDEEVLELLTKSGLKSLTLAPEAGSERLRRVVNKGIDEDDILYAAKISAELRIEKVKLYFMIGLPGERREDIEAIVGLSMKVREYVQRVEVSVNPLVPKPHTPFQFLSFGGKLKFTKEDLKELKEKVNFLRRELRGFEFKPPKIEDFAVQTVISRGNRDVFELIKAGKRNAFRNIFRLGFEKYLDAMGYENMLWRIIDHGYGDKRIEREFKKAMKEAMGEAD